MNQKDFHATDMKKRQLRQLETIYFISMRYPHGYEMHLKLSLIVSIVVKTNYRSGCGRAQGPPLQSI